MPELPEVETVRVGLNRLLPGRQVKAEWHDWPKGFPNTDADVQHFLLGAHIRDVRRRAKVLIIDLDSDYSLVIHLKMTGQLVFQSSREHFGAGHPSESLVGKLPDRSTRVVLTFTDDSKLFFNDQRKFGWMRLMPTVAVEQLDFFQKVGPEPLAADFTAEDFASRLLRRPKSGVKAVLLDQTIIAGIGNIYADESLWGAKIHPGTRVQDIPKAKLKKLYESLVAILRLSIEKGGSTDRNYVDAHGKKGSYLSFANVFRREGKPCPRCGTTIIKLRVAGRGTHICPHCQVLPPLPKS
ncbi:MAG TPA: bifunctional DNA-formamidopyrimidine glycosylase/DNA-(apurinic or apyrimidinic site) lyase [Candidatus Saccharimonadales bacterium]|jgi:formamidopyrimidine-DNA glycosylase|nr:bifunctional DNA-formamidopyrimidine glycosylase/DNA-(apurinic or apyrimidinic site) lyase [Candidatus Saccharimonadales bacterium]